MENKIYSWLKTPFQAVLFRDPTPEIYSGCIRRNSKIAITGRLEISKILDLQLNEYETDKVIL